MQQEYQIKYLRAAMRDLEGIAQLYLGLAGADSAEKFIDEILHTVDLLRTFPYSGALPPDCPVPAIFWHIASSLF